MRHFKLVLLVVSLTALAAAGLAVAKKANRTHTDTNGATFTLNQQGDARNATCAGEDGAYREFKAVYTGASTSGDPRLAGTLTFRVRGLVNTTTDRGTVVGRWHLRSTDGKRTAGGALWSVYRMSELHGVLVGRVKDRVGDPNEELRGSGLIIANFKATYPAAGTTISGTYGGVGINNRTPAAIQDGGCSFGGKSK